MLLFYSSLRLSRITSVLLWNSVLFQFLLPIMWLISNKSLVSKGPRKSLFCVKGVYQECYIITKDAFFLNACHVLQAYYKHIVFHLFYTATLWNGCCTHFMDVKIEALVTALVSTERGSEKLPSTSVSKAHFLKTVCFVTSFPLYVRYESPAVWDSQTEKDFTEVS